MTTQKKLAGSALGALFGGKEKRKPRKVPGPKPKASSAKPEEETKTTVDEDTQPEKLSPTPATTEENNKAPKETTKEQPSTHEKKENQDSLEGATEKLPSPTQEKPEKVKKKAPTPKSKEVVKKAKKTKKAEKKAKKAEKKAKKAEKKAKKAAKKAKKAKKEHSLEAPLQVQPTITQPTFQEEDNSSLPTNTSEAQEPNQNTAATTVMPAYTSQSIPIAPQLQAPPVTPSPQAAANVQQPFGVANPAHTLQEQNLQQAAMTQQQKRILLARQRQFGFLAPTALLNLMESMSVVWRQVTEERMTSKQMFLWGGLLAAEARLKELQLYGAPPEQLAPLEAQMAQLKAALHHPSDFGE